MQVEYIKNGRFPEAIWISDIHTLIQYSASMGLSIETAVELWNKLTVELLRSDSFSKMDKEVLSFIR